MKNTLITLVIASCFMGSAALADDDCTDPVSQWQPRDHLRQMMEDKGWEVKRIKVDDGCYEVKGFDRKGNRVKAKFSPASLKVIEIEIEFTEFNDGADYLDVGGLMSSRSSQSNRANHHPTVTIK